jgi:hypothetical protein
LANVEDKILGLLMLHDDLAYFGLSVDIFHFNTKDILNDALLYLPLQILEALLDEC